MPALSGRHPQRSIQKLACPVGPVCRWVVWVKARVACRLAASPIQVLLVAHEVLVLTAVLLRAVLAGCSAVRASRQRRPRAQLPRGAGRRRFLVAQASAHKVARAGEVARLPAAKAARARLQCGACLALIANCPVCIRYIVLAQELQPVISLLQVKSAIARCVAGAPLGSKDRNSIGQSRRDLIPELLSVRVGVEVDRVGQVLARDWVFRGNVNLL
mmetsp:Transcript_78180/g.207492  ORF Transcript_78180/g.207492 Transcript_78180/m.207492 type:complete len:216 (+) Transcript_78180:88-735(+)